MTNNLRIEYITRSDIIELYGKALKETVKGWSVWDGDELAACCGLMHGPSNVWVFSTIKDIDRHKKITIWRMAKKIMMKIKESNYDTVYAVASNEIAGSGDFLIRLGFVYMKDIKIGRVYQWGIR